MGILDVTDAGEFVRAGRDPRPPPKQDVATEGYCVICREFGPPERVNDFETPASGIYCVANS